MCGIAGAFGPTRLHPRAAVLAALAHRGPDDSHHVQLEQGWLGVRRLSIVDIEGGRQPVRSGRITVAMNGEVYNHGPLRRELEANGRVFHAQSDTEVVAALIDEVGIDRALERMEGQFAIAASDGRQLWLARDRLGQKPLYWTMRGEELRFGSELKALLSWPDQPRSLDRVGLQQLLMWEYIPAPRSIYEGVQKLARGSLLHLEQGRIQQRTWWRPPLPSDHRGLGRERWEQSVRTAMYAATRKRVQTELPIAVLLSGGIDSSIVAVQVRAQRAETLNTFSVVFPGQPSFDESGPARRMADHLQANHTEVPFTPERLPEVLDALQATLCEPMSDGSLPSTWLLGQAVHAAGFKIALSGDGADEHFGGYPTYLAHSLGGLRGRRLLRGLAQRLPGSTDNLSRGYLARRFTQGLGLPLGRRNQLWLGAFLPDEVEALVGLDEAAWEPVDQAEAEVRELGDVREQAMGLDQRLYLSEGVLVKADRASMMHSVELRSPFLDHRLCAMTADIPTRMKVQGRRTKVLLRDAFAAELPRELRERPKKGFGTPLGPWLRGPLSHLLEGLGERLDGLMRPELVATLCSEHLAGHRDHRRRLWTLILLSRWLEGPWGPT